MSLLPHGHPSGRHSEVDWSKPDLDKYPDFAHAEVKHMMPPDGVDPAGCDVSVVPLLLTRHQFLPQFPSNPGKKATVHLLVLA